MMRGCRIRGRRRRTHDASDITSGTLAAARIPNLAASKITSGQLAAARMPTDYRAIVIGTSPPGDTTALWIDTN